MNKELKKILLAIAALIFCVLVMDFTVGRVLDSLLKTLPSEGERVAKSNYVLTKVNTDIVIIGSSRAVCHYDSRLMQELLPDKTVFNCGVDGSLFFFQIAVINCILDRYTPEVIIWDLQMDELAENEVPENLGLLYPYYWSNPHIKKYLDELEPELRYKIWLNSYRFNATGSRILRSLRLPESNQLGFGGHESSDASRNIEQQIVRISKRPIDEGKVSLFKQIIKRIQKTGSRLILVHSPYYFKYIGTSTTTEYLDSLSEVNSVEFINDSQLSDFIGNKEYVYDPVHFNSKGAKAFTELLLQQINQSVDEGE